MLDEREMARQARRAISRSRAHNSGGWVRNFFSAPIRWRGQHQQEQRLYI